MNDDQNRRLNKAEEEDLDRKFASKGYTVLLYLPGTIALAAAFGCIAAGLTEAANTYIVVGIFINLLSGFLDMFRRRLIRQDQRIKRLEEQLNDRQPGSHEP